MANFCKSFVNVSIPVLVTEEKQPNSSVVLQTVRPIFGGQPVEQAANLARAINKLIVSLRKMLEEMGRAARHDELARMCFAPSLSGQILQFRLNLGAENFDCRYFFVTFAGFERRVCLTPNVADLWFEIERGEDLATRAVDVLTVYFKQLERRFGRGSQNPAEFNFAGKTWLTTVEFDIVLPQKYEPPKDNFLAMLGGAEKMNGADELRKVGRNLDALFPHELERAVLRDAEIEKLTELLEHRDRRAVLIIGKRLVGKTALIHEYTFRQAEKRSRAAQGERNVFLLAPQRLVAGMMFVGQWEDRLLAIIAEAKTKQHLLYFDDLIGLFSAGKSANSDLSMAQVLKPYLERREVRVVGEITLEAWRVLQERDRSFADLFQIVRVDEPDDNQNLRIALHVRRESEHKFNCNFALDALPTALDLTRRYERDAAFPGKSAIFVKQLAAKFSGKTIERADVLREFEIKSGLNLRFLDEQTKLDRAEIVAQIERGVIGQQPAVEAAADAISIAKARLNDPNRPLASFLFLGATSVGKTEAAKQIARFLYGDDAPEKLLRFDMNEFVSPFDAARLVGTFDQPEGLLTNAIRRQPFAVVLLDEIEKAHSDVFNLLLQVLGDGRLTDAVGRTADFTNAIIILTSNLGAREANAKMGFRQTDETDAHVYRQAAEKFFRPEFFNRFDRVIGFERLSRREVEQIANLQLAQVLRRDGLLRRNCKLNVAPDALRLIVDAGYDPQLGARALKRQIEKLLTQPVAARLAAIRPDAPLTIEVTARDRQIAVEVQEIKPPEFAASVWLTKDFSDVDRELDRVADTLDRIEDHTEKFKPIGEIVVSDQRFASYYLLQEHIKRIERMIARAEKFGVPSSAFQVSSSKRKLTSLQNAGVDFSKLLNAPNLAARLKELAQENRAFGETAADYVQDIWRETALLEIVAENVETNGESTFLQIIAPNADARPFAEKLLSLYVSLFVDELGLRFTREQDNLRLDFTGAHAAKLAQSEAGTHIFINPKTGFTPIEVRAAQPASNVVRVYDASGNGLRYALDFRSGLAARNALTTRELRAFVLSGLPAPRELVEN